MAPLFRSLVLMAAALAAIHPAFAAGGDKQQPAVALSVDVQRILDDAEAAKGVQKLLNAQRAAFQSETEKEENQLRQAEHDLGKARAHLGAAAFNEREQQLRQRFISVERHVDMRRKMLDQSFTDAMNLVRDNLLTVVQTVAHERGANLVLVKQQVLWVDKTLDVTDEVLARLNKALPAVTVKPPEDAKAAP